MHILVYWVYIPAPHQKQTIEGFDEQSNLHGFTMQCSSSSWGNIFSIVFGACTNYCALLIEGIASFLHTLGPNAFVSLYHTILTLKHNCLTLPTFGVGRPVLHRDPSNDNGMFPRIEDIYLCTQSNPTHGTVQH